MRRAERAVYDSVKHPNSKEQSMKNKFQTFLRIRANDRCNLQQLTFPQSFSPTHASGH